MRTLEAISLSLNLILTLLVLTLGPYSEISHANPSTHSSQSIGLTSSNFCVTSEVIYNMHLVASLVVRQDVFD